MSYAAYTGVIIVLLNLAAICTGLGCLNQLCQDNVKNSILNANCSVYKQHCGSYGGKRFDNSLFYGVDITCNAQKEVYAPFSGNVSFFRPRGGQNGSDCIDFGLKVVGHGQWSGYAAMISFVQPIIYSGSVKTGDILGHAVDFSCAKTSGSNLESHIVLQLLFQNKAIDPTYRIADCMCTGQICSSNPLNAFIDKPFKHKTGFGKGYELNCQNTKLQDSDSEAKVPDILSPIEAGFLGRFRPWNMTAAGIYACENDGVFLVGAGKWTDFVVNIYNVKFSLEPGDRHIVQGEKVAKRLSCHKSEEMKSIFMEFRHKGRLVNITNLISAKDCKLPQL